MPTTRTPAKVKTDNSERGPLLLFMGGRDHTVAEAITKTSVNLAWLSKEGL